MSEDLAASPTTQVELEVFDYVYLPDRGTSGVFDGSPSLCCTPSEEDPGSPPVRSQTPSFSPTPLLQQPGQHYNPGMQLQRTLSKYTECPADLDGRKFAQLRPGTVIGYRFEILDSIGQGSFGAVYRALDLKQGRVEVAVKVAGGECFFPDQEVAYKFEQFLDVEWQTHLRFGAPDSTPGIPRLFSAGTHQFGPAHCVDGPVIFISYLAMPLLGESVWEFSHAQRNMHSDVPSDSQDSEAEAGPAPSMPQQDQPCLSRSWIVNAGKGMLKALAGLHSQGFIHRDVKTENFCLDADNTSSIIHLIDLGFARRSYGHYDPAGYDERCASFWGTPAYASLSGLMSFPVGPRDDLEALVYCLFELETKSGRLPWGTLIHSDEAKDGWDKKQLERMCMRKQRAWYKACAEDVVPQYLQEYFGYITSLTPWSIPDYQWLVMQLESGLTGQPPSRQPRQHTLPDWQSARSWGWSTDYYSCYAINAVATAAAAIVGTNSSNVPSIEPGIEQQQQQHGSSQYAGADWHAEQYQQHQQQQHEQSVSQCWDLEEPFRRRPHGSGIVGSAADVCTPESSPEGTLHVQKRRRLSTAAVKQQHVPQLMQQEWPVLAESQTEPEE